jgi:predicted O-methyltransferase YrrM
MNRALIFFRISRYLKYIMVARNRKGHGIHSPFVFDLVSRVFRNKTDPAVVYYIENVRKRLKRDKRIIDVTDLGSGSERGNNTLKRVSDIARDSAVPQKYGLLLARMAAEFGGGMIVEFGTSFGISTMYMATRGGDSLIYSMEGCPATAAIAESNFKEAGLNNVRLYIGSFRENLPGIISTLTPPGLIFIDGDHRKEQLIGYFGKMAEISDNNTVIIIDDINYSREMEEAWFEITQHPRVSVSIDIHRMGIVFFRKGIGRNNYIIRY